MRANVAHYCVLDENERTELRALMQVLLKEKYWEGCGGLELTDEIRITIAAHRHVCCCLEFLTTTIATCSQFSFIHPLLYLHSGVPAFSK
ncbi:MAG: zinc-dependent peptidase [Pseudomonadota bacterium]